MGVATSSGRWQNQAALEAALRFGPQRSALRESALEAQQTYANAVRAARGAATLTQRATMAAKPQIQQIYSGALAATQPGVNLVSQALSEPGVPAAFRAAGASEAQQQIANLNAASARDQALLHQQGVSARAGAQFAQTNAQQTLQKTLASLLRKNSSLGEEQGTYAATEAEKLAHEAEKLEQAERASIRSSETSRANNRESTGQRERSSQRSHSGSSAPGGVKQLSGDKQQQAASHISTLRGIAEAAFKQGHSRGQVLSELTQPRPSIKLKTGGTLPGREGYAPDVLMSAALDAAQFGGVTRHTLQRLHESGYSVQQLGLRVVDPARAFAKALQGAGSQLAAAGRG